MAVPRTSNDPIRFEGLYPATSRGQELEKIFKWIRRGSSAQVVGIPGVGRSNVLALLAHNRAAREKYSEGNEKWYHFVYMDFSEIKGRSAYDTIKFMLISLSFSLSDRAMTEDQKKVNEFIQNGLAFRDDLILFQSLKRAVEYLAIEKELTVIFLFDRFDQYTASLNEQFFINLKTLRNRAKYRFSVIFSLSRPLEDILEPSIYFEFYEFFGGNTIYLPLYDPPGTEFRFSYLEKIAGKETSEKTKKELLHLTGGHGKLSRVGYEALLQEETQPKNLEEFLMSKKPIIGTLWSIWLALLPEEHKALQQLAQGKNVEVPEYLLKTGLVEGTTICIPLLVRFIKNTTEIKNTKIHYDSEKNEILQGEESLTDKLSPSEFRLLRFLIQNAGKVCEKDSIISAVWKDVKTQEGVTDQALDQIIYRLRKKVEDNPNNPLHITTIKGRGYKFIQ